MPDRPSRLKQFKQWSRSHEQLLSLPKLPNLLSWRSSIFAKSTQTDNQPSGYPTTPQTPTLIEPTDASDRQSARRKRSHHVRLYAGFRSLLRSPVGGIRFSSMDVLPTSPAPPTRPSASEATRLSYSISRPHSIQTDFKALDPCCPPPSDSWLSVNEADWRLEQPSPVTRDPACSGQLTVPESPLQPKSSSTLALFTIPEKHRVKFDLDAPRINICSADVEPYPPINVKIHLKCLLGQGANGFCHEVQVENTGETQDRHANAKRAQGFPERCALKVIPSDLYRRKREAIHREISVQRKLSHPNLLKLYTAYRENRLQSICLLLEFCALGSLMDLVSEAVRWQAKHCLQASSCSTPLNSGQTALEYSMSVSRDLYNPETGGLSEALARHIFRGLMRALDHLHQRLFIVHRDIKPSNVMLADGYVPKLSDFGLACTVDQCTYDKSICGTPNYLAPEVFLREGHSIASDCWAAGATLYFMLCARAPFQPTGDHQEDGDEAQASALDDSTRLCSTPVTPTSWRLPQQQIGSQVRSVCRCLLLGRYEFPASVNQSARHVIQKLLQRDPNARPSAFDILRMEFCAKQLEDFQDRTKSEPRKHSSRLKLFPTHPKRVMVERLRRARSFCGLHRARAESSGQQLWSPDVFKRLVLPERLSELRRSASERIRQCRPTLWTSVTEKTRSKTGFLKPENRLFCSSATLSPTDGSELVGNTVFTGNEAIYDIFKLLSGRAKPRAPSQPDVFHWVSRWALTSDTLLYYTLGHVIVETDDPAQFGPPMHESWGVTNVVGQGIACHENRMVRFERKHNIQHQATAELPPQIDVQKHCEFLIRQLKRFDPIQTTDPQANSRKDMIVIASGQSDPVFVERWQEHGNNVIFLLSTGGWQVNFHNHSKLIIHYPNMLLASDAARQSKEPCYANSVEFFCQNLEVEFRRWLNRHPHLDHILQILLFMLL